MRTARMRWTKEPKELLASTCLCLLAMMLPTPQVTRRSDIAVVVHPDTPVSDLSLSEVRRVFLGERQYWNSKTPVELIIRAPGARERELLLKVIYEMTENQYKGFWIAKNFRAEAVAPPKMVYTNEQANELLSAIPGAIAVMERRDVRPGLKIVRVEGLLPGEAGYRLH